MHIQAPDLPEREAAPPHGTPAKDGAQFADPAFAANKQQPIHRWVPWIAGFAGDFVRQAVAQHLARPGTILDPFAGVGTTLVEAVLMGHNVVGFEINPYAALACRVKAQAYQVPIDLLHQEIDQFQRFYAEKSAAHYTPQSTAPLGFRTRAAFYSPQVLHKVLILQDFIATVQHTQLRDLFRLAFAATMVQYSNYSYEPSLGRRVSAGKAAIDDFPVAQTITAKLRDMEADIALMQRHVAERLPAARIINDSFFQQRQYLEPQSIDLIVTSPPYLNNYHYNRNTRPHLYWLGYAERPQDLKALEEANFGTYWQTVREQACLDLAFELPDPSLKRCLHEIRMLHPERGIYGGNGWANYAARYFNDCHRFARCVMEVLKPGGSALIVIGNSILQGVCIPTDLYFGQIAEALGLELLGIDIPRTTRVGNSIIQSEVRVAKAQNTHQLYEAVVTLRKPC